MLSEGAVVDYKALAMISWAVLKKKRRYPGLKRGGLRQLRGMDGLVRIFVAGKKKLEPMCPH
jgi:hypothetical protein